MGDFGAFSFNGNKIITTGGGGMAVAKEPADVVRMKHLSTQAKADGLYYEHDEIGYNYRLTNLQAALGLAQLEQLELFIKTKNKNYSLYSELLEEVEGVRLLQFRDGIRSNKWFYALACNDEVRKRDKLIFDLQNEGIQTRPIWGLIHEQKPYGNELRFKIERATFYRQRVVNLPCSTDLKPMQIRRVVDAILKGAGRES